MIAVYICIIPSQYRSHRRAKCLQTSNRWFENQTVGRAEF